MSQKKYYLCRRIDVEKATFDDADLYPNPYIVVTQKGYTKHYYAGTERLNGYIVKVNNKAHKVLNL